MSALICRFSDLRMSRIEALGSENDQSKPEGPVKPDLPHPASTLLSPDEIYVGSGASSDGRGYLDPHPASFTG